MKEAFAAEMFYVFISEKQWIVMMKRFIFWYFKPHYLSSYSSPLWLMRSTLESDPQKLWLRLFVWFFICFSLVPLAFVCFPLLFCCYCITGFSSIFISSGDKHLLELVETFLCSSAPQFKASCHMEAQPGSLVSMYNWKPGFWGCWAFVCRS